MRETQQLRPGIMGATKQTQKTVAKTVTTKTAVTQKQSLEIVQTLLHGAVSFLGQFVGCDAKSVRS